MDQYQPKKSNKITYENGKFTQKKSVDSVLAESLSKDVITSQSTFEILKDKDPIQCLVYYFVSVFYEIYTAKMSQIKKKFEDGEPIGESNLLTYCKGRIEQIMKKEIDIYSRNIDRCNEINEIQEETKYNLQKSIKSIVEGFASNIDLVMDKHVDTDIEHSKLESLLNSVYNDCKSHIEKSYETFSSDKRKFIVFDEYKKYLRSEVTKLTNSSERGIKHIREYVKDNYFISEKIPIHPSEYNKFRTRTLELEHQIDLLFMKADEYILKKLHINIKTSSFYNKCVLLLDSMKNQSQIVSDREEKDISLFCGHILQKIEGFLQIIRNEGFDDLERPAETKMVVYQTFTHVSDVLLKISSKVAKLKKEYETEFEKNGSTLFRGIETVAKSVNEFIYNSSNLVQSKKENIESIILSKGFYLKDQIKPLETHPFYDRLKKYKDNLKIYTSNFVKKSSAHNKHKKQISDINNFIKLIGMYQKQKIDYIANNHNSRLFKSIVDESHTVFKGLTLE